MSSLIEDIEDLKNNQEDFRKFVQEQQTKQAKKKFKLPLKARKMTKRMIRDNSIIVVFFGSNKRIEFERAVIKGGLVHVKNNTYQYDPSAVYYHKKIPMMGIVDWRLTPVGDRIEEYQARTTVGDEDTRAVAEHLGVHNYAQKTIIRGIENAMIKEESKMGGKSMIMWIIIGGIIIAYLISQAL